MAKKKPATVSPELVEEQPETSNQQPATSNQDLETSNQDLVAAYQALLDEHNALKEAYHALISTPADGKPLPKNLPNLPADIFEVDGASYRMALPKLKIKGVGERTALEVLLDDEPYAALGGLTVKEYLVSTGSIAVQKV